MTPDEAVPEFNRRVMAEFRANAGQVAGRPEAAPLLILHTIGAKSGQPRTVPLLYRRDRERYVVFASFQGRPHHPAWYYNLLAHPRAQIEVGDRRLDVEGSVADTQERQRLFTDIGSVYPQMAEYQTRTSRVIPVVLLTPVA